MYCNNAFIIIICILRYHCQSIREIVVNKTLVDSSESSRYIYLYSALVQSSALYRCSSVCSNRREWQVILYIPYYIRTMVYKYLLNHFHLSAVFEPIYIVVVYVHIYYIRIVIHVNHSRDVNGTIAIILYVFALGLTGTSSLDELFLYTHKLE